LLAEDKHSFCLEIMSSRFLFLVKSNSILLVGDAGDTDAADVGDAVWVSLSENDFSCVPCCVFLKIHFYLVNMIFRFLIIIIIMIQ